MPRLRLSLLLSASSDCQKKWYPASSIPGPNAILRLRIASLSHSRQGAPNIAREDDRALSSMAGRCTRRTRDCTRSRAVRTGDPARIGLFGAVGIGRALSRREESGYIGKYHGCAAGILVAESGPDA